MDINSITLEYLMNPQHYDRYIQKQTDTHENNDEKLKFVLDSLSTKKASISSNTNIVFSGKDVIALIKVLSSKSFVIFNEAISMSKCDAKQ